MALFLDVWRVFGGEIFHDSEKSQTVGQQVEECCLYCWKLQIIEEGDDKDQE